MRSPLGSLAVLLLVLLVCVLDKSAGREFPCWSYPVRPYLIMHPCQFTSDGRVQCRCNNFTLDCSSNFGNLTYIPSVFQGVKVMNFSNNGLTRLMDQHFLVNVSRDMWLLDLYNNGMTYIDPNVFKHTHQLRSVLIGGNNLSYEHLKPIFTIPNLNNADMKCMGLGVIPKDYFNKTPPWNLRYLDLSWNNIGSLDMRELQPMRSLRNFTLRYNKLYTLTTASMPSIIFLNFLANRLFDFPVTCKPGTNESLFPNLRELILDFNEISSIPGPLCVPKLANLNIQFNRIAAYSSNMFSAVTFPALTRLRLNQMERKITLMDKYAFNNSGLTLLELKLNNIDFSSSVIVHHDVFAGCSGLKTLYLTVNNFQAVSNDLLRQLLHPLPRLETLSLGKTELKSIADDTFTDLSELYHLDLFENALASIPDGAFDQLTSLRYLSLGGNRITTISSSTFSLQTRKRLKSLDLSDNPYLCTCDIVWFQQWLRTEPHIFEDYGDRGYHCANVHNKTVKDFYINQQACLLDRSDSVVIIIITCFLLLLFILFTVIFGYRWHFRLWLYAVCRGYHQRSRRQEDRLSRGFRYDVFLAYAEEDMGWVQNELLPVLEEQWLLRVCVHQRDFVPGKHIVDNIADCVEVSDRIILVFSPHFARSQWCQFELKFCQTCVMERDDVMVLVKLQETESRDMSGAMLAVLRTTTYIEWEDEDDARISFWGRLARALGDVIPRM